MCQVMRWQKSLRLDPVLEKRLQRAAAVQGESLSEFMRRAAADRADRVLTASGSKDFADVLGAVHGGGRRARRTGEAFTEIVREASSKA
jgi:hypothetical protein